MNRIFRPRMFPCLTNILINLLGLSITSSTHAEYFNLDLALKKLQAPQFSLGLVGFIGEISDGETAMRSITREDTAEDTFNALIKDENNTSFISKLYGLCGLKIIKSRRYSESLKFLKNINETVPVRQGDIIHIENVKTIAKNINSNLCTQGVTHERN